MGFQARAAAGRGRQSISCRRGQKPGVVEAVGGVHRALLGRRGQAALPPAAPPPAPCRLLTFASHSSRRLASRSAAGELAWATLRGDPDLAPPLWSFLFLRWRMTYTHRADGGGAGQEQAVSWLHALRMLASAARLDDGARRNQPAGSTKTRSSNSSSERCKAGRQEETGGPKPTNAASLTFPSPLPHPLTRNRARPARAAAATPPTTAPTITPTLLLLPLLPLSPAGAGGEAAVPGLPGAAGEGAELPARPS